MIPADTHGKSFMLAMIALLSGDERLITMMEPAINDLPDWMILAMAEGIRQTQEKDG